MKVVPVNKESSDRYVNINYLWGIKVVQWTVLYAPGGRSLRNVNAKTEVTTQAKIYSIPPEKGTK